MHKIFSFVFWAELQAALHLGTVGEWWAARAARRYGKFSGTSSGPLKWEAKDTGADE